jgi:hypothetical protein
LSAGSSSAIYLSGRSDGTKGPPDACQGPWLPNNSPASVKSGTNGGIRTGGTAAITSTLKSEPDSVVVAYQADLIDYAEHLGWSVTVVGVARQVTDRDQAARYRRALRPWIAGEMDQVIAIHAELVTGFRLVGDHAGR